MNEYKTFEELERFAYISNLPKIANLYAKLDDDETYEYDFDKLRQEIRDLEYDIEFLSMKRTENEDKIEALEIKLEKIADVVNE